MTGIEYLLKQIDAKREKFDEFCTAKCYSSSSEILDLLKSPGVSFDFVIIVSTYLGIELWANSEEDDESEKIEPATSCVELQALFGVNEKSEEYQSFCEECLVCTRKSKDRLTRKEIYSTYLDWCDRKGVQPSSDKALYKWLRTFFVALDDESLEIEYRDYKKQRGFKGLRPKQIGED